MTVLHDLTEKEWDAQLFNTKKGLATMLGWNLCYHTLRSKGSASGFPDRVLVRERVVYAELKSSTGRLSPTQVAWLDGLASAGAECYVWFPSDLDEIANVLGKRWTFHPYEPNGYLTGAQSAYIEPDSLWIPGHGRRDALRVAS